MNKNILNIFRIDVLCLKYHKVNMQIVAGLMASLHLTAISANHLSMLAPTIKSKLR